MYGENPPDELKIYELSLIWKEAEYNFAFWERLAGTLDWNKAYRDALAAVLKTKNLYEYYLELMKFISLLRDGHTGVWFPAAMRKQFCWLPLDTKLIGGEMLITNAGKDVPVRRFSAIKKYNGVAIDEYIEKNIYPYIWHEKKDSNYWEVDNFLGRGAEGSTVELETEYAGVRETVTVSRIRSFEWQFAPLALKPLEELREVYQSASHRIAMTKDDIAVITIDTMRNDDLPREFWANFPLLEKARGYVIDVRNNEGGNSGNSEAVAAMFIGKEVKTERDLRPVYIGTYKAWAEGQGFENKTYEQVVAERGEYDWIKRLYKIPRHIYYEEGLSINTYVGCPGPLTGPLVLLSSPSTVSAAEDFLVALDYAERAAIVGQASYGSTGQPLFMELESGGSFRICTRHCTYPDGREFINTGIQPHIPCELSLDDYRNGVDSVLDKGIAAVRERGGK